MATPPNALLPIDDELRGALSREIAYEDNLYFMRSIMGAGIKTGQDTMDFIGDMRATSKGMSADNRRQIKKLKGKDVMSDAERQGRVDTATAGANQRADQLGKEVAAAVAMNPSRAAGAIQAAGREQSRMTGLAAAEAETRVDALEASREGQRVEELLTREDAEMQRKQARTKAKFDFTKDILGGVSQVVAATRPRTREAQLETERLRGAKKADALTGKLDALETKSKGDLTDNQSDRYQKKYDRLHGKRETAKESGKAAGQEADLLQRAKQAQAQENLAAYWGRYTPDLSLTKPKETAAASKAAAAKAAADAKRIADAAKAAAAKAAAATAVPVATSNDVLQNAKAAAAAAAAAANSPTVYP
tara:strand:- start:1817 stop:2905 length:1089 start_codon:yes stop_codon:yes gene_type:complete